MNRKKLIYEDEREREIIVTVVPPLFSSPQKFSNTAKQNKLCSLYKNNPILVGFQKLKIGS